MNSYNFNYFQVIGNILSSRFAGGDIKANKNGNAMNTYAIHAQNLLQV